MLKECWTSAEAISKVGRIQRASVPHQRKIGLSYAKDAQTRGSVSGYVVYLEDAPTMHRSTTQKTVALSSCEAELNAAVLCAQDMMYQTNTLESIGLKVEHPMILEVDNKGAVDLVNSSVSEVVRNISTQNIASYKNSRKQKY